MAMRGVMSYPSSCGRPRAARVLREGQGEAACRRRGVLRAGGGGRVEPEFEFDEERIVARTQGREGWLREARQLEQHRWQQADPIPRSRTERLLLGAERLEVDLGAECRGNEAYEQFKERRRAAGGRWVGGPPKPYQPPDVPAGR